MAAKEHVTEQIKHVTDLLRLFWLSLLGIGGGTAGLVLGDTAVLKAIFAAAGVVVVAVSVVTVVYLHRRIGRLIDELKEI